MITSVQQKPTKQRPGFVSSLQELAGAACVSRRTVTNWAGYQDFPREPDGSISVWKAAHWWHNRERGKVSAQEDTGEESKAELEREKLKLENEDRRLKLKIRAGDYISREAVVRFIRQAFAIFKSRAQSMPGECTSAVPTEYRAETTADMQIKVDLILRELGSLITAMEKPNELA